VKQKTFEITVIKIIRQRLKRLDFIYTEDESEQIWWRWTKWYMVNRRKILCCCLFSQKFSQT